MKEKQEKSSNKKVVMVFISIIGSLAIIMGVSYAWFTLSLQGTKTQIIKTATLELTLDESSSNGITLDNAMPLTDANGLLTTSYKFTLKNTGTMDTRYDLKLVDQTITGTRMPDTVVKYWFTKNNSAIGPTLLSTATDRIFDSGLLQVGESIDFELKIWIDYEAGNEIQGTQFSVKIAIEGTQLVPTNKSCFTLDGTGGITSYNEKDSNGNDCPKDVVIPSMIDGVQVTTILDAAFGYQELTSVTIPSSVTYIGEDAFYNNYLTNVIIPDGVTYLGGQSFYNNLLTKVTIPESVTNIEEYAFSVNQLTSIIIPESVTTIGNSAFTSNELTSVIIQGKSSSSDFTTYGDNIWGWASGYSDDNITWNG